MRGHSRSRPLRVEAKPRADRRLADDRRARNARDAATRRTRLAARASARRRFESEDARSRRRALRGKRALSDERIARAHHLPCNDVARRSSHDDGEDRKARKYGENGEKGERPEHAETRLNLRARASAVKYRERADRAKRCSTRHRERSNLLRFALIYGDASVLAPARPLPTDSSDPCSIDDRHRSDLFQILHGMHPTAYEEFLSDKNSKVERFG